MDFTLPIIQMIFRQEILLVMDFPVILTNKVPSIQIGDLFTAPSQIDTDNKTPMVKLA